jgi:HEPN domain-containing protein
LLEGPKPYLDTAVFHCQQAAEKALKAFLAYHDIPFVRTHDLTELVRLSVEVEPSFATWNTVAQELTPYAVQFRYPGEVLEPAQEEAERALRHASALFEFVLQLLPADLKP